MAIFSDQLISELPNDPKIAVHQICQKYLSSRKSSTNITPQDLDNALESYALLEVYNETHSLELDLPRVDTADSRKKVGAVATKITEIRNELSPYVKASAEEKSYANYRDKFTALIDGSFGYEFTDGDIDRVYELIEKISVLIRKTDEVDDKYRQRLLSRLEKFRAELSKKMSTLDSFLGLIYELKIFIPNINIDGELSIEIKNLGKIVWQSQARAAELSSDTKPLEIEFKDDQEE